MPADPHSAGAADPEAGRATDENAGRTAECRMPLPNARQAWTVFSVVSLVFFFLNGATFTSLGVVLWTMMAELKWSNAEAGFSFSLLGIACGVASPLPAWMMKRWGGRWTLTVGCVALAAGFFIAAASAGLASFYVAMLLLGTGFALTANVPGVYLLSAWFPGSSSRIIGLYLMLGAFGATAGPPVVNAIVAGTGGWRGHWQAMAWTALALAVLSALLLRDRQAPAEAIAGVDASTAPENPAWTPRDAMRSSQFVLVAAAMTLTTACITTNSSVTIGHLVRMGATPAFGAVILSILALVATLAKGAAGRLGELMSVPHLLGWGLVAQAAGNLLLGAADTSTLQYAAALTYGIGWGVSYVAATVVVLNFFGREAGSQALAFVWLITTIAAGGPLLAGFIADRTGSFSPIFWLYAALLFALALPVFLMKAPVLPSKGRLPR